MVSASKVLIAAAASCVVAVKGDAAVPSYVQSWASSSLVAKGKGEANAPDEHEMKKEKAEARMKDAERLQDDAQKHMQDSMHKLEQMLRDVSAERDAKATAHQIEADVKKETAKDDQDVRDAFQKSLASLAKPAADGPSMHDLAAQARRAAHEVARSGRAQMSEMRHRVRTMSKAHKDAARRVGDDAKAATREAKHAARELERARRKAGVREEVFERDFAHSERIDEGAEDHAENMRDAAEDAVEHFWGRVEDDLERREESLDRAADDRQEELRRAREAGERASKETKSKSAASTDAADEKVDTPAELVATAEQPAFVPAAAAVGGFSLALLGSVVLFVRRRVGLIREAPLLG